MFDHVFVVGAGGTTSYLMSPLGRLLSNHPKGKQGITIIDGDEFSSSNSTRQEFSKASVGENKANYFAGLLKREFDLDVGIVTKFIDGNILKSIIDEADSKFPLCYLAVDNDKTRTSTLQVLNSQVRNFHWISPGNNYYAGQVMHHYKIDGELQTECPTKIYSNLANPTDYIPGTEPSCAEVVASVPQSIAANMGAAWISFCMINNILNNHAANEREVLFDSEKIKVRN